jgi:hypothetical protein
MRTLPNEQNINLYDARRRSPHHSAISPFSPKTAPPSLVVKTALRIFMDARKSQIGSDRSGDLAIGSRTLPTIYGQLRSQGQVAFDPQNQ